MKKLFLSILAMTGMAMGAHAQSWTMVVTNEDGTTQTFSTGKVKNVSFSVADENVESIIIKEIYNGGCPLDEGTSFFQMDKGFILYNNSPKVAVANNLCVGIVDPMNAHAQNNWYSNGSLTYSDYVPASNGIWYFQQPVILQPYEQLVVSCNGAVDNTRTHSQSVNYADSSYYAMYDPEAGYTNTSYYPTPSDVIPTSHYLKAVEFGQGNAWLLSVMDPGLFIFQTKGTTPSEYANNNDNYVYAPGRQQTKVWRCLKVPVSWIVDGVEVWPKNYLTSCQKRFTHDVDNGHVDLTNKLGHSLYRNVDKTATEALPENAGKLIYNYTLAVDEAANGDNVIDAEASIRKGAHILYLDDNNSSTDFHERQHFSLRDTK